MSTLKDAGPASGGFPLTGQEVFLEPYRAALADIGTQLGQLGEADRNRPSSAHTRAMAKLVDGSSRPSRRGFYFGHNMPQRASS
jgi:hypothetical protein